MRNWVYQQAQAQHQTVFHTELQAQAEQSANAQQLVTQPLSHIRTVAQSSIDELRKQTTTLRDDLAEAQTWLQQGATHCERFHAATVNTYFGEGSP